MREKMIEHLELINGPELTGEDLARCDELQAELEAAGYTLELNYFWVIKR